MAKIDTIQLFVVNPPNYISTLFSTQVLVVAGSLESNSEQNPYNE